MGGVKTNIWRGILLKTFPIIYPGMKFGVRGSDLCSRSIGFWQVLVDDEIRLLVYFLFAGFHAQVGFLQ